MEDHLRPDHEGGDEGHVGGAYEGAVAKACHKELAEFYEDRLSAKGLTVSIEPDCG